MMSFTALQHFHGCPLNIFADSAYIVGTVQVVETAFIHNSNSEMFFNMFKHLHCLIQIRTELI